MSTEAIGWIIICICLAAYIAGLIVLRVSNGRSARETDPVKVRGFLRRDVVTLIVTTATLVIAIAVDYGLHVARGLTVLMLGVQLFVLVMWWLLNYRGMRGKLSGKSGRNAVA
jgi:Ca2+/Na+ antiporter